MKPKTNNPEEYNKQLDELAKEAMKCILRGAYSNPIILGQLGQVAIDNKLSIDEEVAERSYLIASVMLKRRTPFLMKA